MPEYTEKVENSIEVLPPFSTIKCTQHTIVLRDGEEIGRPSIDVKIIGRIIKLNSDNTVIKSNEISVSDDSHKPDDYIYQPTNLINMSRYDSTTKNIGIVWLGENIENIYCQICQYIG